MRRILSVFTLAFVLGLGLSAPASAGFVAGGPNDIPGLPLPDPCIPLPDDCWSQISRLFSFSSSTCAPSGNQGGHDSRDDDRNHKSNDKDRNDNRRDNDRRDGGRESGKRK